MDWLTGFVYVLNTSLNIIILGVLVLFIRAFNTARQYVKRQEAVQAAFLGLSEKVLDKKDPDGPEA